MKYILIYLLFFLISCNSKPTDEVFSIYHLKPNSIYESSNNHINGSFSKRRNDFFVVKNYDIQNEQHKIMIDSFVVNHIKNDSFLLNNDNVNWRLTFFKYGDGINENTKHIDGTDYAIHNLFSYKKEIATYYFDTRDGYGGTNYNITRDAYDKRKRKIVSNYLDSIVVLQEKIKQIQEQSEGFDPLTFKQDTIRVVATFIQKTVLNELKIAQYKFEEPIARIVVLEGNVLNVAYRELDSTYQFPKKAKLTIIKNDEQESIQNYFVFPDLDPEKGVEVYIEK